MTTLNYLPVVHRYGGSDDDGGGRTSKRKELAGWTTSLLVLLAAVVVYTLVNDVYTHPHVSTFITVVPCYGRCCRSSCYIVPRPPPCLLAIDRA